MEVITEEAVLRDVNVPPCRELLATIVVNGVTETTDDIVAVSDDK